MTSSRSVIPLLVSLLTILAACGSVAANPPATSPSRSPAAQSPSPAGDLDGASGAPAVDAPSRLPAGEGDEAAGEGDGLVAGGLAATGPQAARIVRRETSSRIMEREDFMPPSSAANLSAGLAAP